MLAREVFDEPKYVSLNGVNVSLDAPIIPQVIEILRPVLGQENAEQQSRRFIQLWKNFGKEQTTLEQWV